MARNENNVQGQFLKTPKGVARVTHPNGYQIIDRVGTRPVDDDRTGPNKAIKDKDAGGL